MEIGRFEGTTQEELYDGVYELPWEEHMNVTGTLWIDFTGQSKDIRHTQFAARKPKMPSSTDFVIKLGIALL